MGSMHVSCARVQHAPLLEVLRVWGRVPVAPISIAASVGTFPEDTGSSRLVRAGWRAGMLGAGLVLCIASRANGQRSLPTGTPMGKKWGLCAKAVVSCIHAL